VLPKSLKTLILADNPLKATPQFINDFTQYLRLNQQLTLINLQNCLLGFPCIQQVLPVLQEMPILLSVELSGNTVSKPQILELINQSQPQKQRQLLVRIRDNTTVLD